MMQRFLIDFIHVLPYTCVFHLREIDVLDCVVNDYRQRGFFCEAWAVSASWQDE